MSATADHTIGDADRAPVPLEIFQDKEEQLFRVGYRLATSNAVFCRDRIAVSGLLVHDAESYGNPDAVRQLFHLTGDIGVQAVAPGSPAAEAGIEQNDSVLTVSGKPVGQAWPVTDPRWKRIFDLRDSMDKALTQGSLALDWQSTAGERHTALINGVPACATRFELIDSKKNAAADGDRVLVGENFPGFRYDEDAFAAAIAHEMAHNIYGHPKTFAKIGWKRKLVRLSERDADRLTPWLLHNAGYDPRAAIRFWETYGPRHGGWIFRARTHDGWDERVEFIEAEIIRIEAVADADGKADWQSHFVPELAPALAGREQR